MWCPDTTTPAPSLAALRDRTLRLLPHVAIGAAWSTSTLINVETVLWAELSGILDTAQSTSTYGPPEHEDRHAGAARSLNFARERT